MINGFFGNIEEIMGNLNMFESKIIQSSVFFEIILIYRCLNRS